MSLLWRIGSTWSILPDWLQHMRFKKTLQRGKAWPPPTLSPLLMHLTFMLRLCKRTSEGYRQAPEIMTRKIRDAGKCSLRRDLLELDSVKKKNKLQLKLRLSLSLVAFMASTNPEEKMGEGSSYLTGIEAACIIAIPGC